MKKIVNIIGCLLFCSLVVQGCSQDLKDSMGMSRSAPDEYQVLKRPPLSVPPDFNLEPPKDGEDDGNKNSALKKDKKTSSSNDNNASLSESDKKFMKRTNKFHKNSSDKSAITEENASD